jgi:nicotinamide riboside transporter PnuC
MILQTLPWIAICCTVVGLILAGRKHIFCWPIWLIGDVIWIYAYSVKKDWPIVVSNVIFIGINILGWIKWRKENNDKKGN